ncbi:MAG: hypothetical protein ABDH32_04415 [Candidatus Caldarchaeales archaeon]
MFKHPSFYIVSILILTAVFLGVTFSSHVIIQQDALNSIKANVLIGKLISHENFAEYFDKLPENDKAAIMNCINDLSKKWETAGYTSTYDPPPDEIIYKSGERISIWGCPDTFIMFKVGGHPETLNDFKDFIKRRITLLKILATEVPDYKIETWVSPVKPLTLQEYESLVSQYKLEIISTTFKYIRKDTGELVASGGRLGPWLRPPEHRLETIKEELLPPGVEIDYRIVAFAVSSTTSSLINLQKDPLILIVDIGPLDVLYRYANSGAYIVMRSPKYYGGDHLLTAALLIGFDPYELKEYVMQNIK